MSDSNNFDIYDDDPTILSAPSEVLEHIFSYLDGKSFFTAMKVCKTWYEIIKFMQKKRSIWQQFCLQEIPKCVLEELLEFKTRFSNDTEWTVIYKKWICSRMILNSHHWKKTIPAHLSNAVTCVRVSGSWIITGHSNGLLCIWNMLNGELRQSFMCHLKIITDIALVDLLNLGSYYGTEDLPWSHHHMITISKDRYIHVLSLLEPMMFTDSDIHINYHTNDLEQIRVFNDMFAVSCRDNTVSLWKMNVEKKPYFHLKVSLCQKIVGPAETIICLGLWHDQVQCFSHLGSLRVYEPEEEEWVQKRHYTVSYSGKVCDYIVGACSAYLFRQNTVILLLDKGKIVTAVNNKHALHHFLMPSLGTGLSTVAFCGTILALGGDNGKLFLYYVSKEIEILSLDWSRPHSTVPLSEEAITSIDISFQQDSPVIVACSTDSIYVVKWYKGDDPKVKQRNMFQVFPELL